MLKLKSLLLENTIQDVEDISQKEIWIGELGLEYLTSKIAELNKKAKRWGVDPLVLRVISEKDVPVKPTDSTLPTGFKKSYNIKIDGTAPKIEGYEFIAKIEHTENGNVINIAPKASIKNLPSQYRDANSECNVCHTRRERLNTFILKKEDTGELMMVGSSCLKRFLNNLSVSALEGFAALLDEMRSSLDLLPDVDSDGSGDGGGGKGQYFELKTMIFSICLVYLGEGKYISKKKASELMDGSMSTAELSLSLLYPSKGEDERKWREKLYDKSEEAKTLSENIIEWGKNTDWSKKGETNPGFENFYNNLSVLLKGTTARVKNMGYLGALVGMYLAEQHKKEKDANTLTSEYVGNVGDKITFVGKLLKTRDFPSQYGVVTLYSFIDESGNQIVWWSSNRIDELVEGGTYKIMGTVKKQEVSKYGGHKETTITRAKVIDDANPNAKKIENLLYSKKDPGVIVDKLIKLTQSKLTSEMIKTLISQHPSRSEMVDKIISVQGKDLNADDIQFITRNYINDEVMDKLIDIKWSELTDYDIKNIIAGMDNNRHRVEYLKKYIPADRIDNIIAINKMHIMENHQIYKNFFII